MDPNSNLHFLDRELAGSSLQQWLQATLLFLGLWLLFLLLKQVLQRRASFLDTQGSRPLHLLLLGQLSKLGLPVALPLFLLLSLRCLNDLPEAHKWIFYALMAGVAFRVVRFGQALIQFALDQALSSAEGERRNELATLRNLSWVANFLLWILAGVFILSNAGVNVSSALAGLGIGGIAVALSAQKVLGDLFASISILLDRPFRVGETIKVDEVVGNVERIGMRTTKVRSVNGEEITIPNSTLAQAKISNLSRASRRRVGLAFKLPLGTPAEKRQGLAAVVEAAVQSVPDAQFDLAQLGAFEEKGLDFEIGYFVPANDPQVTRNVQHEVNLAILAAFEERGIALSVPQKVEVLRPETAA